MNPPERSEIAKDQTRSSSRFKRQTVRAKRGEGAIYDVIDEWLAPAFVRWIAEKQNNVNKEIS